MANESVRPMVRGRILVGLRAFIKETFGEHGWSRFLAEVPPSHREVLDGLILGDSWHDREIQINFVQTTHRLWSGEMEDVLLRMGRRSAAHLGKFYLRPFLKMGGPLMVLKRASALYRENFQGGEAELVERRDSGGRVDVRDPYHPPLYCEQVFAGFCEAVIVLGGKTPVRVEQELCRFRGDDVCRFDLEFK